MIYSNMQQYIVIMFLNTQGKHKNFYTMNISCTRYNINIETIKSKKKNSTYLEQKNGLKTGL